MTKWNSPLLVFGFILFPLIAKSWCQTVPDAPAVPTCSWDGSGAHSTCKFKDAMAGTPTSVVGKKIILFIRSAGGGNGSPRDSLRSAVVRLADRYGFTATVSEDPAVFTAANLADAKVVIMGYGDGDVVPAGATRKALEDFQQVNGWGLIWINAACAFITSGWPFGQQSCVEQYYHHDPSGTFRRVFIDSGTSAIPNQGRKNPQSEFLLRQLPGWNGNTVLQMADKWMCFRAPARNTAGVNVLFGYDRGSGLPVSSQCPAAGDSSDSGSQNHNLAWTHKMGDGITIVNSMGHDPETYISNGNAGDSLLWRFIRYAAKDWCVGGSGEPGCDMTTAAHFRVAPPETHSLPGNGILTLTISDAGRSHVSLQEVGGRRVFSENVHGPGAMEIPGLKRGVYLMRIRGAGNSRTQRIMVY